MSFENYDRVMKNIQVFGERYCKEHLDCWDTKLLQNNWWEALDFFFGHSFMRGRRDELSNEYHYFTIEALEDYFSITKERLDSSYEELIGQKEYFHKDSILNFKKGKNIGRGNSIKHKDFTREISEKNPIIKLLTTPRMVNVLWAGEICKKRIFLGNDEDVMMVLDCLKFISEDRKNIYNHFRNEIATFGVKTAYKELIEMRAISDKIASFVIRDIALMNSNLIDRDYDMAFPVDTWVKKIARKLGCNSEATKEIKTYLINKCQEFNVNPLKIAAGLWFLGFNSLDLVIEKLGKVDY